MTRPNRSELFPALRLRGFSSLDALFSILPVVLMVVLAGGTASVISRDAELRSANQVLFDKLVSIADYTVKSGAVMRNDSLRYPNWIDESLLSDDYSTELKEKAGLEELAIRLDRAGSQDDGGRGHGMCIYRIVVAGPGKAIHRLVVCGS
jgi:hypothetical protein